nr:putative disease resistance protein RGA3 [Malus domestica]
MAEALISVLLEQLASVTYQQVGEEVKLVLNAKKDVDAFAANLEAIGAVLEGAEQRQVKEASVRNWLEKLKDVSYKMDNVLDEWKTEILKQQVEKEEEHGGSTSLVNKKKKKKAIKSPNENLDVIAKQRGRYNFRFTERVIIEQPERDETTSFVDASIIFGREEQKEVLVS